MPSIQPTANAGAVTRARLERSISTVAMIGIGLIATPRAAGSRSPSAAERFMSVVPFVRSMPLGAGDGIVDGVVTVGHVVPARGRRRRRAPVRCSWRAAAGRRWRSRSVRRDTSIEAPETSMVGTVSASSTTARVSGSHRRADDVTDGVGVGEVDPASTRTHDDRGRRRRRSGWRSASTQTRRRVLVGGPAGRRGDATSGRAA